MRNVVFVVLMGFSYIQMEKQKINYHFTMKNILFYLLLGNFSGIQEETDEGVAGPERAAIAAQ